MRKTAFRHLDRPQRTAALLLFALALPAVASGGAASAHGRDALLAEQTAPATQASEPAEEVAEKSRLDILFESGEDSAEFPVTVRIYPLLAADGNAYVSIVAGVRTVDLPLAAEEGGEPAMRLRITGGPGDGPIDVAITDSESFRSRTDPATGHVLIATSISLPPGRYRFACALEDPASGRIGTARLEADLPDYPARGLTLGPVVLSSAAEAAAEPAAKAPVKKALPSPFEAIAGGGGAGEPAEEEPVAEPELDPFRFGAQRLTPCFDASLARGSDLAFFYEVYGTSEGGDPAILDVTYRFEKSTGTGWRPVGRPVELPGQRGASQGFTVPAAALDQWPGGDYRVTITVKEAGTDRQTEGSLEFSLVR